ncbi:MAG: glycoside hydrolase family 99-like domain-containing protein [Pseudomonadota bacterium]
MQPGTPIMDSKQPTVKVVAHYLPQFHPIPENDRWWGKGFTEWTNVGKATPIFRGQYQPRVPADLGYYDLRVPEVREAQAQMALDHGIEGFCYWHYWFAGKRLLERPFNEVLKSGKPRISFCLAWANQTWTGVWHGAPGRVLIEQTYPGVEDYKRHFEALLESFRDERYIRIDGKPIFIVYDLGSLPQPNVFTDVWREMAAKAGLKGLYFIGNTWDPSWVPAKSGFDAALPDNLSIIRGKLDSISGRNLRYAKFAFKRSINRTLKRLPFDVLHRPTIYSYRDVVDVECFDYNTSYDQYPMVIPNWDNTPRSGKNGIVFQGSTPELFRTQLRNAIDRVKDREKDKRIVFVKSWNEWAEGNHLEPDLKFGMGYLNVVRDEVLAR